MAAWGFTLHKNSYVPKAAIDEVRLQEVIGEGPGLEAWAGREDEEGNVDVEGREAGAT